MKDPNEAMDRVLTGLRDVSAPVGMEQRVRTAMERRAAARRGWGWRSWSVGLAAMGAMVVAGVVLVLPHRRQTEAVARLAQTEVRPSPAPAPETSERNTEILRVPQNDLGHRVPRAIDPPAVRAVTTGGIPTPPMPLTEQERLLLRVAHRQDATELTPLNAEARAKQNAEFDAEFQEFFSPQVTAVSDTNSNEKEKGETQ